MRIAMFLDTDFPPDPRVENEATSLVEAGHEVFLFTLNYKNNQLYEEEINGIEVFRYKAGVLLYKLSALAYTFPFYHWMVGSKIKNFIARVNPHILHVHDMPLAKAVIVANAKQNLPLVLDLHEDRPEIMKFYPHLNRGLGKLIIKPTTWEYWQKWLVIKANYVIVVTGLAKNILVEKTKENDSKIIVVPNTIRSDIFYKYPLDEAIVNKYSGKINILYLGDTNMRRGTDTAIEAIALIKNKYLDINLILVGKNQDDLRLKQIAKKLGVEENISFEGWRDLKLFPSYLMAADITISPLKRNQHHDTTLANKIFQYMAMGKPVVVSDCPAQAEVIEKANCGLVHIADDPRSLADKIVYLIEHKDERLAMGENAKKAIVETWDWRFKSKDLINLYHQMETQISVETRA
jgi:glycosyltransferase involved in cell wall biosynthesis